MSTEAGTATENGLPPGWAWAHLGEISSPVSQVVPSALFDDRFTYLDISSIDNLRRLTDPKRIPVAEAPSRARQLVATGDTLFSTVRTYLRNVAYVDERFDGQIASTGFCVLRPNNGIEGRYIFYYVITRDFIDRISAFQRGVSYPAVRDGDVRAQLIPVAPTNEQRRIVEKIDELFSQIDAGEHALERAQKLLERYRQSVLNAAVTGELTREWRERHKGELESGETLLKCILRARREAWEKAELAKMHARGKPPTDNRWRQKYKAPRSLETKYLPDLPEGWVWVTLEMLSDGHESNGISIKGSDQPPGVPALRLDAVQDGYVDFDAKRYIPLASERLATYQVAAGDFLVSRANGSKPLMARAALVPNEPPACVFPDTVIRFRPVGLPGVSRWLNVVWSSRFIRQQLESRARTTAGIWKVSQSDLRAIALPMPSLQEADVLASVIDTDRTEIIATDKDMEISCLRSNALRESILSVAFSGKLVPQDPADQPASVLLERIREERAAPSEDAGRIRTGRRGRPSKKGGLAMVKTRKEIKPTHLQDIIRASNGGMVAEALWKASDLAIDDFYKQLREEVAAGHLREERDGTTSRIVCR